jgi:proteasome lid subunit RPN8/RPN11
MNPEENAILGPEAHDRDSIPQDELQQPQAQFNHPQRKSCAILTDEFENDLRHLWNDTAQTGDEHGLIVGKRNGEWRILDRIRGDPDQVARLNPDGEHLIGVHTHPNRIARFSLADLVGWSPFEEGDDETLFSPRYGVCILTQRKVGQKITLICRTRNDRAREATEQEVDEWTDDQADLQEKLTMGELDSRSTDVPFKLSSKLDTYTDVCQGFIDPR